MPNFSPRGCFSGIVEEGGRLGEWYVSQTSRNSSTVRGANSIVTRRAAKRIVTASRISEGAGRRAGPISFSRHPPESGDSACLLAWSLPG